jgi:hypothetical protein
LKKNKKVKRKKGYSHPSLSHYLSLADDKVILGDYGELQTTSLNLSEISLLHGMEISISKTKSMKVRRQ